MQTRGLEDISLRSTSLPGYESRLFLGQVVLPNAAWDELNDLVELTEGCVKVELDPVMDKLTFFTSFKPAPTGIAVEVLRNSDLVRLRSFSNLLGIISPREIDDWAGQFRFQDGRIAECACGLHSKQFAKHAKGSLVLEALLEAPVSKGYVRTCDHNSGLLLEPLDAEARSGQRGAWRLSYYSLTDVNGQIPDWAAREGTKRTIVGNLTFVQRELVARRSRRTAA